MFKETEVGSEGDFKQRGSSELISILPINIQKAANDRNTLKNHNT
jgi:hypothetical protein